MENEAGNYTALPWSDRFRVGVEVLDADHRTLVQKINKVCSAWAESRRGEALKILDTLIGLAGEHFVREERILSEIPGYTQLRSHRDEHTNRLKQLTDLRLEANRLDASDAKTASLEKELVDWFVKQSIGHDAAIKSYFDDGR